MITGHSATNYTKGWTEVRELISKGNYRTAHEKAQVLFDAACTEQNSFRILQGAVMLAQAESSYEEEATQKALDRYRSIEGSLNETDEALRCIYLAEAYQHYYDWNDWNIRRNLPLEEPTNDIAQWDEKTFQTTIRTLQDKALAAADVLKRTPIADYAELLEMGNKAGQTLCPTLYDVVVNDILNYNRADNDDEIVQALFEEDALYGTAKEFCSLSLPDKPEIPLVRNLTLLQELTRFHLNDKNADALHRALDEKRLDYIRYHAFFEKVRYREGLERLVEAYKLSDERTEWYYRQAEYWSDLQEEDEDRIGNDKPKVKAYGLARKAIEIAPKSLGAIHSKNLIGRLEHPELSMTVPTPILPGQTNTAILKTTNLNKVWLRLVKATKGKTHCELDHYLKQPVLKSWSADIIDPRDYESHENPLEIPSLAPGEYVLLASSTAKFDKKQNVCAVDVDCSAITLYIESIKQNGQHLCTVVDRKTGNIRTDCKVAVYSRQWRTGKTREEKLFDCDINDKGFFRIPAVERNTSRVVIATDGASTTERTFSDNTPYTFQQQEKIALFSDRYSYRPSDEVQFSLVVYNEEDVNHFVVCPDREVTVELHDVNGKVVSTMEGKTDEFGCYRGTFKLGPTLLPGRVTIQAHTDDARHQRYLNVEAYKQPTFAISFEEFEKDIPLTAAIPVRGSAISYTAVPVQNAAVTYVITRTEQPSIYWWRCIGRSKTVARGTTQTAADGTFHFDIAPMFSKDNPKLKDRCYRYDIHVEITAVDGETQSHDTSVRIGKPYEPPKDDTPKDVMPSDALLWGYQAKDKVEAGETATLKIGSAKQDVCVVWFLEKGYDVVDYGTMKLSNEVRDWTLQTDDSWKGGFTLRLVTYKENEMKELAYSFVVPHRERELGITLTTFRDRLTPGEPEKWTLHIENNKKQPVEANLVAALYDAALDVYGENYWNLAPWHTFYMWNTLGRATGKEWSCGVNPSTPWTRVPDIEYPSLLYLNGERIVVGYGARRTRGIPMMAMAKNSAVVEEAAMAMDDQAEFVEVQEVVVSSASQKTVYSHDGEIAGGSIEKEEEVEDEGVPENVYIRQDLTHTAFFEPCIRTDANGNAEVSFTAPDLLTEWNFQGLSFTKDLKVGKFLEKVVTRKELMVQPNLPRFLRQGDSFEFTAKVSNISEADMEAKVRLQLTDARTGKPLKGWTKAKAQTVSLAKDEVKAVSFAVNVPEDVFAITYLITAVGNQHSDGEQGVIAVLTNRTLVTESLSMYANAGEKKSYTMESLKKNTSKTLIHHKLSLEYTSNPIWYAIQALPALDETTNPSIEQLFHRYYANSLSLGLIQRHPQIEAIFQRWAEETPDAFLSQLEKNNDLKQIILSETPWILQAESETADRRRIADFFQTERAEATLAEIREQLLKLQNADGGWSWMPGFDSNAYITMVLLRGFGELREQGCIDLDSDTELRKAIANAIAYVDNEYYKDYLDWLKWEKENSKFWEKRAVSPICTNYLFTRSFWKDFSFKAKTKNSYDYFYAALKRVSHIDDGLMTKALTALTFYRNGDKSLSDGILKLLDESALYSDEMGMYWRSNVGGWFWHNAPVETQSMLIRAYDECSGGKRDVGLMQQWILKQKQTTRWSNSVSSAHAVYALLLGGGSQALDNNQTATLTIGGKKVVPERQEAGTGYFRTDWEGKEITRPMANVTIDNSKNPSCSWGALYWQYFENLDKVEHSEQGFSVSAYYYKVTDDGTLANIDGPVNIGDKIRVRLRFTVDRNLEYVQVKALRPAGLEPVSTRSGRTWNGGLSYYLAVEDAATSLYIDYLSKGDYTVEFDCWASQSGSFLSGIVTLQCLYAPEFRATFSQPNLTVVKN
ncbi:MAG: hypothetical protein IKS80_01300 [Bacteroidaceae bacterium]|nr:hypothetical protein [Bacteroidaceae bacterium]